MAYFESDLWTHLNGLGITIYPLHVPQSATFPCVVFSVSSTEHLHNLAGAAGIVSAEYSFECISTILTEAETVAEQLRRNLDGFRGTLGSTQVLNVSCVDDVFRYEPNVNGSDLGAYVTTCKYKVQYSEVLPTL